MLKNKTSFKKLVQFIGASLVIATLAVVILPSVTYADTLYRQLQTGMRGADVSSVQTFLAQDPTMYPQGLVTGYFGFLTKSAVANFQSRNGIPAVGRIGPATLPVMNAQMANGMGGGTVATDGSINAAYISGLAISVSNNSANVSWNTNEAAKGVVYYSTSPLVTYENANSVNVSGGFSTMTDANYNMSQNVSLQNLQANTTYYYMVYTTDQTGNVSVSWPATFRTNN